jgi:hypothetical protein
LPSSNFFIVLSPFILRTCPNHFSLRTLIIVTESGILNFYTFLVNIVPLCKCPNRQHIHTNRLE